MTALKLFLHYTVALLPSLFVLRSETGRHREIEYQELDGCFANRTRTALSCLRFKGCI